jgi:hypothetical protein
MVTVGLTPAIGGEIPTASPQLTGSADAFEGMLAIKEGHGDILVRAENGQQKRFKVKRSTIITRNGEPASFDDLRARDQLRVHYDAKRVVIELQASGS